MAITEAATCRNYVLPKLYGARWDDDHITEQKTFTDGRIVGGGDRPKRRQQKRADYLLRYRPDFTIAVIEARPDHKNPGDGLQQAKDYAQILGLSFAYSTNGHGIVEHDCWVYPKINRRRTMRHNEGGQRLQQDLAGPARVLGWRQVRNGEYESD